MTAQTDLAINIVEETAVTLNLVEDTPLNFFIEDDLDEINLDLSDVPIELTIVEETALQFELVETGPDGDKGDKGDPGEKGDPGDPGTPGLDGSNLIVDTQRNLLTSTPAKPTVAYSSDYRRYYLYDGSNWYAAGLTFIKELASPDMGYFTDNSKNGYKIDSITDKDLYNITLGSTARNVERSIKIDTSKNPPTFEIRLRGKWNTIIYDFTTAYADLRHTPRDKEIFVWRGDSIELGLNGLPVTQEYKVSRGAYPAYKTVEGGTF